MIWLFMLVLHTFDGQGHTKHKLSAYRPSYAKLGELRSLVLRNVPIFAMTATAEASTRSLIKSTLCMTDPLEISSSKCSPLGPTER